MNIQIIQDRIKALSPRSKQEEENVIKQIYQEIALYSLSRAGYFRLAAFQGGTCLRLVYGMPRFSEDLDFILIHPDTTFVWEPFLKHMTEAFALYSIPLEAIDRSKTSATVQRAFLKQESFGKVLQLGYPRGKEERQNITIRLEVDTNPPAGSGFSTHYLDFPLPYSLVSQDKPSLFASKCHALLCRDYVKGRDWYDFIWYVATKTPVNLGHLKTAMIQTNDWTGPIEEPFTGTKLLSLLNDRVESIDWKSAAEDVANYLGPQDKELLAAWSRDLFAAYIDKLATYIAPQSL